MSQAKKLLNKQLEEQTKLNDKHEMQKDKLANELIEDLKLLGRYVETQVTNDEEIERLYEENARHIKRINELAADNERLIDESIALENENDFKDGQIIGYKRQIKELNNEIKELKAQIDKLTNNNITSIVKKAVEGVDAMEQTETTPKKKPSKLDMIKKLPKTKEFSLKDANEEIKAQTKEEVKEETKEIELKYERYDTKEAIAKGIPKYADIIIGVNGSEITISDKTYKFKARREYYMPVIYGCFDEKVALQAREEIKKIHRFNLASERTTNDVNFKYAQDKEYPIVVWRIVEGNGSIQYHAYAKTKGHRVVALTWDEVCIIKTTVESLFSNKPAWRKIDSKALSDKFMAVCKDIWPEDFTNDDNDPKSTKVIKHITKEISQNTNEIVVDFTNDKNVTDKTNDKDATDVTNEDPTAGCDDLDI